MFHLRICFLCGAQIGKCQFYILYLNQTEGHQPNVQFNVLDVSGWKNVCVCQHCENVWKFLRAARLPRHSPQPEGGEGKGDGGRVQRRLNSSDLISDTVSLGSQYGAWVSLLL